MIHDAGSSGGSGNSVGARLAPVALCEDTGGSCRMPASANGIYGFRPSLGCYNFSTGMGLVPAEFTRDTIGMCILRFKACCLGFQCQGNRILKFSM